MQSFGFHFGNVTMETLVESEVQNRKQTESGLEETIKEVLLRNVVIEAFGQRKKIQRQGQRHL